ncbi:MAG: cupin domain-containing protein [Solirubrobacterales bacterium]
MRRSPGCRCFISGDRRHRLTFPPRRSGRRCIDTSEKRRRCHPNEEIFYVIAGEGEIEVDDVLHRVEAGTS